MFEKVKIIFFDMWKLYEKQMSVSLRMEYSHAHLHFVYGFFTLTQQSWRLETESTKHKILLSDPLQKTCADLDFAPEG